MGISRLWLAPLLALAVGCDGEGRDDLVSFSGSGCKFHEEGVLPIGLLTLADATPYQGLSCLSWQASPDGTMRLDVLNFSGPCLPEWSAQPAISDGDGHLALEVENPVCGIGACGSCIYDWSFEVGNVALEKDLELSLLVDNYPDDDCEMDRDEEPPVVTVIPRERLEQGIICREVDLDVLSWGMSGFGTLNMPCMDPGQDTETDVAPCQGELVCDTQGQIGRCRAPCADRADCPSAEIYECADGQCVLAETWQPA